LAWTEIHDSHVTTAPERIEAREEVASVDCRVMGILLGPCNCRIAGNQNVFEVQGNVVAYKHC
jgi:hypothetical protein